MWWGQIHLKILMFSRSMWRTAIRAASSRPSGFAMTWVQSQSNTPRGGSLSTASSLLWVAVRMYLSLSFEWFIYQLYVCLSSDLRHHRRDVHSGRHHRLLHIHSLWSLEENPDWENVMSSHVFYLSQPNFCSHPPMTHTSHNWNPPSWFLIQIQTAVHLPTIRSRTGILFPFC